jgi:sugar phosphate isomerase/epimerase
MMNHLALGIVSDEIAPDFETALHYGKQWGISLYELRCVGGGRVPDIAEEHVAVIAQAVRSQDVRITALSPGIFKHPVSNSVAIDAELETTLPRTIEMAKHFDCGLIIAFGFQRGPQDDESTRRAAIGYFRRAASIAEQHGVVIAIENEPGFWCDTGEHTAAMLKEVESKHLRANWDPANALGTIEEPFPDGYAALKPYIVNVHVKDTIEGSLIRCVPVGQGRIKWKEQLRALMKDNIVTQITIETHCLPLIEQSEYNIRILRTYFKELQLSL